MDHLHLYWKPGAIELERRRELVELERLHRVLASKRGKSLRRLLAVLGGFLVRSGLKLERLGGRNHLSAERFHLDQETLFRGFRQVA